MQNKAGGSYLIKWRNTLEVPIMLKTMLKLHFGTVMEEKEYWGLLSGLC